MSVAICSCAAGLHVLEHRLLVADDRHVARAERVRVAELAFQRAPAEIHLRGEAGRAGLAEQREGDAARVGVGSLERDEQLDRGWRAGGCASPASRIRSIPAAQPIPGVGGPPSCSTRPS